MNKKIFLLIITIILILGGAGLWAVVQLKPATPPSPTVSPSPTPNPKVFDGQRAWEDVAMQVNFGPRIPGSAGHAQEIQWISAELHKAGWTAQIEEGNLLNHPIQNIVAKRGTGKPWIILGAHYDTRMIADQDPDPAKRTQPVPGANDGASGVAILLELARTLPTDFKSEVWLVFFDAEDQGKLADWDWIMGSQVFAQSLTTRPAAVVVVDMIGDADLNIYQERSSDPEITKAIWATAAKAGYPQFIPQPKFSMIDDHTPFLKRGFPAADLIDFDYPYWHTVSDTPDKVSAASLKAVGDVLTQWIRTLQ
jgi:Zn-dependent M28 family amino/carboxypeptidase